MWVAWSRPLPDPRKATWDPGQRSASRRASAALVLAEDASRLFRRRVDSGDEPHEFRGSSDGPGRIRTSDRRIMSPLL